MATESPGSGTVASRTVTADLQIQPGMGLFEVLGQLLRRGGVRACFQGCPEQIVLTVLKQALVLTTKEYINALVLYILGRLIVSRK